MGMAQKLAGLTQAARAKAAVTAAAPPAASAAADTPESSAASEAAAPAGFKSNTVFATMAANLKSQPGLAAKVNGSFAFVVTDGPAGASGA